MSDPFDQVTDWPARFGVPHAAAAVLGPDGVLAATGDTARVFPLASVSKLLTAYAVMIAVQEEAIGLDDAAGPPGATVRHLLAHTAGYGFDSGSPAVAAPGRRRIYSNAGTEALAARLAEVTGIPFAEYLTEAVLEPLGMKRVEAGGSPAFGYTASVDDLARFAAELFAPVLLEPQLLAEMTRVQFPGLPGVLPGLGRFDPCDWGLGFELNFGRPGHWAGTAVSGRTFGHFGGAGTFCWLDPQARLACIALTDLAFGEWAKAAWPPFCDAVVGRWAAASG